MGLSLVQGFDAHQRRLDTSLLAGIRA